MLTLSKLIDNLPQTGTVQWIGLRPAKRESVLIARQAELIVDKGITGDRYASRSGKRQVTLIQHEHLVAIASMLGKECILPETLRRNMVIKGVNLLALKGQQFKLGTAVLEFTGLCHPCSRMEEVLGDGGYNAVRGHGGITARIIESGDVAIGDQVMLLHQG